MTCPIFISYAHEPSSVHAQALKIALGDQAFLDTSQIQYGEVFPVRLLNGLLDCSVVVIFATEAYLDRPFCQIEMRLALAGGAQILLALGDGCDYVLDALSTVVASRNWPKAHETEHLKKLAIDGLANKPTAVRDLLKPEEARRISVALLEQSQIQPAQQLPTKSWFPVGVAESIGTRFVGRAELLRTIHRTLSAGKGKAARLTGTIVAGGGFGKTRAAVEYLYRIASYYPGGIFWVDASSTNLDPQFWHILKQLDPSIPDLAVMREQGRPDRGTDHGAAQDCRTGPLCGG